MGCFAGSGGHNSIVQGANSVYGKEHVEDRKFLDVVAKYVQAAGWKYVNCSDEVGTTQTAVWSNAANNHLRVADSNVDLQFHLNASPGGTGCEVWLHPSYGNRELAAKISKAMADAFGLRDRGIKFSTELGWINKTKTGLLPEICFIDNETDMQRYQANFDKAAKAVAEVIVGRAIQSGSGSNQVTPTPISPSTNGTGIAYIEGNDINLRKGPGTGYGVIRQLGKGESYKVFAESNGWLNLGGDQWVYNDPSYIRYTGSNALATSKPSNDGVGVVTMTADVLRVRTGPGTNYSIVKNVYQGEKYQSWGYKDGWYNVGGNQWVSGEYVKFEK